METEMDIDLIMYPAGQDYTVDIGDDYHAILRRNPEFLYWCGYIRLPAGHPCIGQAVDVISHRKLHYQMPSPPVELSYCSGNTFGFEHGKAWDLFPRGQESIIVKDGPYHDILQGIKAVRAYSDYNDVLREIRGLKACFMAADSPLRETNTLNTFCRNAVLSGRFSSGHILVITANTADKEAVAELPLHMDNARVCIERCGQSLVLYHDTEDRYWQILYNVATRRLIHVHPWDGPIPPESMLDTAFCLHSE